MDNVKLIKYNDNYKEFIYDVKKIVYKKYVEENWGPWNDEVQKELFDKFIDSTIADDLWIIKYDDKEIGFYNGILLDKDMNELHLEEEHDQEDE